MRLTDLIGSLTDLRPGADSEYILIRREDASTRRISAVSANLTAALADKRSEENIALHARDTVHVFDLAFGRQRIIEPILEELQLQSNSSEPYREVSVSGQVKAPGSFPLETGMRVSDLIRAGGNLAEQAYTLHAELVRYEIIGGTTRTTEIVDVDLGAILRGDPIADLLLGEHDNLRISRVPDWESLLTVTLEGELTFPGEYRIRPGETLEQLLRRAGGLTDKAYAEGAIFLRESLQEREQEQIEVLARRLEADLTSLSLQDADTNRVDSEATGQSLLAQLRETEAVGRLVIDVESIIDGDTSADVELRDNDRLLVPQRSQEVTIIGETQQNTSHLYRAGLSRDDYINLSGGLTRRADKKLIYVVRASGAVVTTQRSRWFGRGNNVDIRPGDTIVVPLEVDRIRPLTLWTSVTQILYQAAIAVAAIDTFGN
jgi:protein involved in polysaccharide export with SLBB domain